MLLHQQTAHVVVTTMRWWDDESGYEKYANHDGIKRGFFGDAEWLALMPLS